MPSPPSPDSHRDREPDRYRSSRNEHSLSTSSRRDHRHDRQAESREYRDRRRYHDDHRQVVEGSSSSSRHQQDHFPKEDRSSRKGKTSESTADHGKQRDRRRRSYDSEEEERRQKKKDKRSRHSRETSQERRERKAAKKLLAGLDADDLAAQRANAAEALMYSAEDNPFNDANIGQQFKWGKKEEKEKKAGMTPAEARKRDDDRRRDAIEEIGRLNAARAQREKEQLEREEEESKMVRLAESAAMSEWVAKEDEFHLEQSRRRAAIRIRENRAKPIDLLAMNLRWADGERMSAKRTDEDEDDDEAGLEIDMEEPYEIFDALTLEDTEELHQDIQMYLTLEKNQQNLDFWTSMIIVCDDKLSDLRQGQSDPTDPSMRSRLDPSVKGEMNKMLQDKTHAQLLTLQEQVRDKLQSGEAIDVEYWEQLLKTIVVWRAKTKLRDLHEVVLENRLEYLRRKQRDEANRQQEELIAQLGDEGLVVDDDEFDGEGRPADLGGEDLGAQQGLFEDEETWDEEVMEPAPVDESRLTYDERHLPVQTWESFRNELISARRKILGAAFVPRSRNDSSALAGDAVDAAEALFAQEAAKGVDVSEEAFNGPSNEAQLAPPSGGSYDWEDKYRPRKPRYFNRVHTGFEWNKYNQTHYDSDNPPPKVVQGYKFNIFYPDLIDKHKAPTYKILREPGNDETVVIRFQAGAPYEDLAFRIVNKPWQYSHKRGFRSSFERGILQLYFNFQRNFYRK